MEIAILLYEGFDELDAVGPYETFATAADRADLEVSLVTNEPAERITASHGLRVEPDGVLGDPDLLVVPGGGWNARDDRGTWGEYRRNELPPVLRAKHDAGATLASVCTGAMLLERAGILDGRPAVTHASALDDLRDTEAEVIGADVDGEGRPRRSSGHTGGQPRVVDDGEVLTAGGITSGIDLALWILERECDPDLADGVAITLEYDRGEVHRA
ncbi:DJ-1/PfpI family protein [Halalkalicoccus salilacus]|uniref:DJ-1/PfpI family protein n=1 Tax=Halalkalicoccus TaxID=332246 RepID=UPI002F965F4B